MKDPCIREILFNNNLSHYSSDNNSKIVEELDLPIGKARIDIAVINGHLHGYEIKSASDTLKRLPNQIEAYSKVFDYLSIVTEDKHLIKILDLVPDWIGIILCEGLSKKTVTVREPSLNRNVDKMHITKLLWRDEIIESLIENDINFRKKDRNWLLCSALSENIELDSLSILVRSKLKSRKDWKLQLSKELIKVK